MLVFEVAGGELEQIVAAFRESEIRSLSVAFDPVDDAVKFKVNGMWSPPFGVKKEEK